MSSPAPPRSYRSAVLGRGADALWLLLLLAYLLAGVSLVPFHPDESEHIRLSGDAWILLVERDPERLADVIDPATGAPRDKAAALRLIDAPLHRWIMGLAWQARGLRFEDLPPFWNWGLTYAGNVALGNRPSEEMLRTTRTASTTFVWMTAVVLFAFGEMLAGRWMAWFASGLFAVNPVFLMHARRAMHEAPLLFFGTLTMWIAARIAAERAPRDGRTSRRAIAWYVAVALASGLTIAAKHTGIVFVAAALAWILVAALRRRAAGDLSIGALATRLGATLAGAIAVVVALTPGLWSHPLARARETIEIRVAMVQNQIAGTPGAPMPLGQRLDWVVTQPYLRAIEPAHDVKEGARYARSLLHGLRFGAFLGTVLTALAAVGIAVSVRRALTPGPSSALHTGVVLWLAAVVLPLLLNPLPWQRYYLPLLPIAALLTGIGLDALARLALARARAH